MRPRVLMNRMPYVLGLLLAGKFLSLYMYKDDLTRKALATSGVFPGASVSVQASMFRSHGDPISIDSNHFDDINRAVRLLRDRGIDGSKQKLRKAQKELPLEDLVYIKEQLHEGLPTKDDVLPSTTQKDQESVNLKGRPLYSDPKALQNVDSKLSRRKEMMKQTDQGGGRRKPSRLKFTIDFFTSNDVERDFDFTLATQTSLDRAWKIEHICDRWTGPIVVVIGIPSLKTGDTIDVLDDLEYSCPNAILLRMPINRDRGYPINRFRNIAIEHVTTTHFLMIDIDFLPSHESYDMLLDVMDHNRDAFHDPMKAFVIPAFQYNPKCDDKEKCLIKMDKVPHTIDELGDCMESRDCTIFDPENQDGHSTTDSREWLVQLPNTLRDIPCFKSNRYEPYLLLRKSDEIPKFIEAFEGYGKNKIEHVVHLRHLGFSFTVLPEVFVIHSPHSKSPSRIDWETSTTNRRVSMDELYMSFLDYLHEASGEDQRVVALCETL